MLCANLQYRSCFYLDLVTGGKEKMSDIKLHNPLLLDLQSSHLSAIFTSSNTADCRQSVFFIHLRSTNFLMQKIQMSVSPLHWSHEMSTPPFIWINNENYSRSPNGELHRRGMKSESYKSGAVMFPSLDN